MEIIPTWIRFVVYTIAIAKVEILEAVIGK
jgi:hypothetical protein